jgi:hypothetical protein
MYYTVTTRRIRELLLPWERNKCYVLVCDRACARARGRVHAVRACNLAYTASNAYLPYCDEISGPSGSIILFDIISQTARFSTNVIEYKTRILIFSTT